MLVIAEKLAIVEWAYPVLSHLYPGESFEYVQSHPYGLPFVFDYPSKLSWHDYPLWLPAQYRLNPTAQRGAVVSSTRASPSHYDYVSMPTHLRAIALCDPSSSAVLAIERMRKMLHELGKFNEWLGTFTFYSLTEEDIRKRMAEPLTTAQIEHACASAQLKADFDFSFLVNSAGLLTRCYHSAGGEAASPVLSKYMVQTLYAVRNLASRWDNGVPYFLTEGKLFSLMHRWKGTGRYPSEPASECVSLGSCASRGEIIESLKHYGLISHHSKQLGLTEVGTRFLERLHPDCEDPDLPYRLAQWQNTPLESRQAVQRYIRTWFGKQKRFMG